MPDASDGLGEIVAKYQARPLSRTQWSLWILLLFVSLLITITAGWSIFIQQVYPGFAIIAGLDKTLFMSGYLATLIISVSIIIQYWHSKRFIEIYQAGVRIRLWGIDSISLKWQELEGISIARLDYKLFNRSIKQQSKLLFYLRDRPSIYLEPTLPFIEEALEDIKECYYDFLFPDLVEKLKTGQPVSFGPIHVNQDAFQIYRRIPSQDFILPVNQRSSQFISIPWQSLKALTIHGGYLVVQSENLSTKKIPISQIPNFELLFKIIEQGVTQ